MSDEAYYRTLEVVERIKNEAIKKFGNLSLFSKACGKTRSWFYVRYTSGTGLRLNTLYSCAEVLDIDVMYLLTGRHKKPFSAKKIDLKTVFNGIKYLSEDIKSIKSRVKTGKTSDISVETLFNLEEESKKNLWELVKF